MFKDPAGGHSFWLHRYQPGAFEGSAMAPVGDRCGRGPLRANRQTDGRSSDCPLCAHLQAHMAAHTDPCHQPPIGMTTSRQGLALHSGPQPDCRRCTRTGHRPVHRSHYSRVVDAISAACPRGGRLPSLACLHRQELCRHSRHAAPSTRAT